MKNIKDVILANQENQGFMARVEHSLSIESLYSVLCEYGYSSDMNEFEQEIYDILKNSDLVKNSVPDDELEKVSGGVNMRQKIMSIVALIGLTVGATQNFVGAAPKHNVSVSKTTKTSEYKKPKKHTTPPAKELTATVTGGVVSTALILSVLARIGNNYIKKQTFSNGTNTDQNTEMTVTNINNETDAMQNLQLEPQEMTYDHALAIIKEFYLQDESDVSEFPEEVVAAVETVESTLLKSDEKRTIFLRYWHMVSEEASSGEIHLRKFPKTDEEAQNDEYFRPLILGDGKATISCEGAYRMHRTLFQYLCRLSCFIPNIECLKTDSIYYGGRGLKLRPDGERALFREVMAGVAAPTEWWDLRNLFNETVAKAAAQFGQDDPVTKFIKTLGEMFEHAWERRPSGENRQAPKCGVLRGFQYTNLEN